jgi:hypothetical protein
MNMLGSNVLLSRGLASFSEFVQFMLVWLILTRFSSFG